MFFRHRRRFPLLTLLLFFIGIKSVKKERMSDEDRAAYREKRKAFRRKMREAFAVWDDEDDESQDNTDTETK
jgi:hypothetical protein